MESSGSAALPLPLLQRILTLERAEPALQQRLACRNRLEQLAGKRGGWLISQCASFDQKAKWCAEDATTTTNFQTIDQGRDAGKNSFTVFQQLQILASQQLLGWQNCDSQHESKFMVIG